MKRLLLCILLLCSLRAVAQDVIVKKDGTKIECRVQKVSKTKVTYKRWTDLEGPNFSLNLSLISAINYENGETLEMEEQMEEETKEASTTHTPVPQGNVGLQTMNDAALLNLYEKQNTKPVVVLSESEKMQLKAKRLKLAGWIAGGTLVTVGAILISIGASNSHGEEIGSYNLWGYTDTWHIPANTDWALIAPGMIALAGGIATTTACLVRSHNLKKKVSQLEVSSAPLFQQEFHLKNGTTLSPSLDMLKDNTHHNTTLGIGLTYNF